jgi:YHS domain-containing protein
MFVAMVLAAIMIDGVSSGVGLIPQGARPTRTDIFSSLAIDYKLFLNVTALLLFVALFWMTVRHGATDPVCGMRIERRKALTKSSGGKAFHFCSQHCLREFEADPELYAQRRGRAGRPIGNDGAHGDQPAWVRLNPVRVLSKTR